MLVWQARTPGRLLLSEEFLRGIAMKSEDGRKFVYFPVERLSWQEKLRFQQLYMYRDKYCLEDIQPYIEDFLSVHGDTKKSMPVALLLRYTKLVEGLYIPSEALETEN